MTPETNLKDAQQTEARQAEVLDALTGLSNNRNADVVQRTRRAVRVVVENRRAQRRARRRTLGLAMMCCAAILMLSSPALWSSVDNFLAGEHFGDLSSDAALIMMVALPALLAALLAVLRSGERTQQRASARRGNL